MFQISEHSSYYETYIYGTLIGVHNSYLYSANSFEEELRIYRKKLIQPRGWELVAIFKFSSRSHCSCSNTVSAAYGIIGDELFIAAYGVKPSDHDDVDDNDNDDDDDNDNDNGDDNDDVIRFFLSSINLLTAAVVDYNINNIMIAAHDFCNTLCNQCCLSSVACLNPEDLSELSIIPWAPETTIRSSRVVGTYVDCVQTKLQLDRETNTCTIQESIGFCITGNPNSEEQQPIMNSSNFGVLHFGKCIYFRENDLYVGRGHPHESKLKIVKESDLQNCVHAGFYRTQTGELQCLAFEKSENADQLVCSIYNLSVDEAKLQAKFTKAVTLPLFLLPSDPRISKFVMGSSMLIWSYQGQVFSYFFGMLSLSKAAFISASNLYSPLYRAYQQLSEKREYVYDDYVDIFNNKRNLGPTENEMKEILGLPKEFKFNIC